MFGVEIPEIEVKEQIKTKPIKEVKVEKPKEEIVVKTINEKEPLNRFTFTDIFREDEDLQKFIWKEDEVGRYRERVIEGIKKYGVKNWFEKMGLPTNDDSIWINRHNGLTKSTLGIEVNKWGISKGLEEQGYYLWENWKPLFKQDKVRVVKCKIVESGFDVINGDDFDKNELLQRLVHSPNKVTNDKIGVTKEEFEAEVKAKWKADRVEWVEEEPEKPIEKVIVKVKYGLDSQDKRDFSVTCENDSDVNVSAHSSAWGIKIGEAEKTLEEKEKECLKWYIEKILETTEDKVEIIREEMNEEDIKKHNEWKEYHRKEDLKYAEKQIEEYSKKLKKALEVKFGCEVVIKVEKKENVM